MYQANRLHQVICTLLVPMAMLFFGAIARGQATLDLKGEVNGPDILLVGTTEGDAEALPVFRAVWRAVPEGNAVFQMLRTSQPPAGIRLMLDRLLEAAIETYLDAHVRFARDGVVADLPAERMIADMDAMVLSATEDLGVADAFGGFSSSTREQLDRLVRIDWSQARFGVDGGAEQDKYLAIYFYVRSQRDELERQLRADLLPLATVAVLGPKDLPFGATVQVNSTCGTVFDEENFLCALDLQLADTGTGGVDPELGQSLMRAIAERTADKAAEVPEGLRIRKRDRWLKSELDNINTRIDRMDQRKELWELRDRMDDIEDRLTGLDLEVREMRTEARPTDDNPLANLSELTRSNLVVRFARNATTLDADSRVLVNEVFEQLARSPKDKVLITGYTDRSGDPAVNLRLSEQRAVAVRNHLLQRGIAPERLLVNHYGDSRSTGRNPDERRVEIEWLR
jgi:outer membrane protein OmpA-like peptidoglycan-associated protein